VNKDLYISINGVDGLIEEEEHHAYCTAGVWHTVPSTI